MAWVKAGISVLHGDGIPPRPANGGAVVGLVLKRSSRLVCTSPVCTDEFKPTFSVVGAKKVRAKQVI